MQSQKKKPVQNRKTQTKSRPMNNARRVPNLNLQRRSKKQIPPINSAHCQFTGLERVTQITVATSVIPGTLLYQVPANPVSAPRLAASASQFDSWYGSISMEVETTGNSFSSDYVIVRHVPNGDPARLPTNTANLLNFAETSDRPGESAKLQLDSNKIVKVSAPWKASYNPRKPIQDPDPSECNNGLFIIVADGSPGSASVNLTIRLRYNIRFYGPTVNPVVVNSSQLFTGVAPLSSVNFLGTSPTSIGFGSATATANTVTFPLIGQYIVTSYATGTGLTAPTATLTNGAITTPVFTNVATGTLSMGTWNINVTAAPAVFSLTQGATTVASSLIQINPLKFS